MHTQVLLCMAFLATTGVSVTMVDKMRAFMHLKQLEVMSKELEREASDQRTIGFSKQSACMDSSISKSPRDLIWDDEAVGNDEYQSTRSEKRATRSVDSAVQIVLRLYENKLESIKKEKPELSLRAQQTEAINDLRGNTKLDLELTKGGVNIQVLVWHGCGCL